MPLQQLPTTGLDDINHRRRHREITNKILTHQFDDSKVRTAAEIATLVTPVNYAYVPGPVIDVRRYGVKADGVTDDTAAMGVADAVATELGGAILQLPAGTILLDGSVTPSRYVSWRGLGEVTKVKAASSAFLLAIANGNNAFIDFFLEGAVVTPGSYVGTGVQIGVSDFLGHNTFLRMYMRRFQTAVRLGAALWTKFDQCRIEFNRTGIDFNAIDGSHYSNATALIDSLVGFNERRGIDCTNVPIVCHGFHIDGGSIEGNGDADYTTYAQVNLVNIAQFCFDATYFESVSANKPDMITLSGSGNGEIANCYFNGSRNGIRDIAGGGTAFISIHGNQFTSTVTKCIDLVGGTQNIAYSNSYDKPVTMTGTGSANITQGIAQQPTTDVSGTSTLIGSTTAGTQTYTQQVLFESQVGNQRFVDGRVTITAKGGTMAGNAQIGGLSIAAANHSQCFFTVEVICSGVTHAAGYTAFKGYIQPGAQVIDLMEEGSANSESAVPVANIAAATTIRFSGRYTI